MVSACDVGVDNSFENDDRDVDSRNNCVNNFAVVPAVVTIEFSQVLVSLLGFTTW